MTSRAATEQPSRTAPSSSRRTAESSSTASCTARERERLAEKAKGLPALTLDARAAADVENIATGAFSPLKGFMTSKDYLRVVREMRLENGWCGRCRSPSRSSDEVAAPIEVGTELALRHPDGRLLAILEVGDKFVARQRGGSARGLSNDG